MLASAHETVSKAIIKGSQKIKFLQPCRYLPLQTRTGHTITEQFRPSGSNEKVQHKKSSRGAKKEIKSLHYFRNLTSLADSVRREPLTFSCLGAGWVSIYKKIHFQLHCWRDSTIKDLRRLLAVHSEGISDEGKNRSKYCGRVILDFCRQRLGLAYLRRRLLPWKKKIKKEKKKSTLWTPSLEEEG